MHKVNLLIHTANGSVSTKVEEMDDAQLNKFREMLHGKIQSGNQYLEVTTSHGLIIIPHHVLTNSVIQIAVDAPDEDTSDAPEPPAEVPHETTIGV